MDSRVKTFREKAGLSQQEMADALGMSLSGYGKLERGERRLNQQHIVKLAGVLQISPNDLFSGSEPGPRQMALEPLHVSGSIAAGVWREAFVEDPESGELITAMRDARFPHCRQYALRVEGDSVNKFAPDGTYVVVVNLEDAERFHKFELKPGLMVHVERARDAGALVEATLKRLKQDEQGFYLAPESTNPIYQPFRFGDGSPYHVEIKGFVLYRLFQEKI